MRTFLKIISIFITIVWLILFFALKTPIALLFIALGIFMFVYSFKYKPVEIPESKSVPANDVNQEPRYYNREYEFRIYDQDQSVIDKFYRFYKYELDANDDYGRSSSQLKEDMIYDEKIYKYLPYLDCKYKLDDNVVYVLIDDEYYKVGELNKKDMDAISKADRKYLTYNHGEYKYYDYDNDRIVKSQMDSYFTFDCIFKELL